MEIPSHRSHKAWLASLALLRGFALGRAQEKKNYEVFPNEQGYLGVDKDRLDQAIYIFRAYASISSRSQANRRIFSEEFSEEQLSKLRQSCASKESTLSKTISPLLREPLSCESITTFPEKLELVYRSNYDNADPKCLEFLRVHWKEPQSSVGRRTILPLLSHFMPGCSDDGLSVVPVSKCSLTLHDAGRTSIYCIEWKSFEYRDAVLSNRKWRRMLQGDSVQEEWKLLLQEWGKADEDISPEEELLLFFLSHGAKSTDSRLVKATLMDGSYFGWSRDQVQQRPRPCLIM
jgi:hypothetical protein